MTQPRKEPGALFFIGIVLFVFCAGLPALELAHFDFGLGLDLPAYLLIAAVGGGLGGLLMADGARLAGLVGGAVAGPCGLLGLTAYLSVRGDSVFQIELVFVQLIASVPGLIVYAVLRGFFERLGRAVRTPVDPGAIPPRDATEPFRPGQGWKNNRQ